MAMFMIGNNYFNDILRVQSELLMPAADSEKDSGNSAGKNH